ncbi:hypothetical protein [Gimesia sp.]|uniref:hypothetical protein n=1 Tax=Gimesia sp. TaxID=2024833 RepID=UPI003A92153C
MQKTSFTLLAGLSLALFSLMPFEVQSEEPESPVTAVKPHEQIILSHIPVFEYWESENGPVDLRKHYPRKTAEKRLQKTLGIDVPQLKFHYGPGPRVYYINGLPTSQLGYRLQQLNSL